MNTMKPTREIAQRAVEIISFGLTAGLGQRQEKGKICVEAAICMAFGMKHSDNPPCVGKAVRSFKISLNDCNWSTNDARASGMKKLAIAQLGSDQIGQRAFTDSLLEKGVNRILPVMFQALADDKDCPNKDKMLKAIELCKAAKGKDQCREAAKVASASASASASAYACASAYAYASAYASASACASAYAYAYASAYAFFNKTLGVDFLLKLSAEIALECLIELKSPGCEWLDLCE